MTRATSTFTVIFYFFARVLFNADKPSLLKMFKRTPAVEADASKTYELSEEDGPWLILATNFRRCWVQRTC